MKALFVMAAAIVLVSVQALAGDAYPKGPDHNLTPGSYCTHPDNYRYPERIPYCNRDVSTSEKMDIIRQYNEKLGYRIERGQRAQFKIDHLIPLCAGGSNEITNLWPQHMSVYRVTDPIEGLACQRMAEGKLTQKKAVDLIFAAKLDLSKAPEIIDQLQEM